MLWNQRDKTLHIRPGRSQVRHTGNVADSNPGPGVDASGRPVVDPTANVIANLNAAVQRQDDLREMESRHVRELMTTRADFIDQLRLAESGRGGAGPAGGGGGGERAGAGGAPPPPPHPGRGGWGGGPPGGGPGRGARGTPG